MSSNWHYHFRYCAILHFVEYLDIQWSWKNGNTTIRLVSMSRFEWWYFCPSTTTEFKWDLGWDLEWDLGLGWEWDLGMGWDLGLGWDYDKWDGKIGRASC